MYLAPLNYDRFFKKIFGKKRFAKAFLEDFLNIKIEKIEILERKNFITDKALPIEFDYRCSLDNGEQIIIEMQQWFKTDIIRRFYLYHSLSTSLQLETLEEKIISVDYKTGKIIKDKLYNDLKPAITLIWMVDDNLNFKEDYITYQMAVKQLNDFVKNDNLWSKSFDFLLRERKKVLELDNNDTKNLKFISENQLTFIFQKNIVKNINKTKSNKKTQEEKALLKNENKYSKWFNFALKTKNKDNKKDDFTEFKKDKLFVDIMNILLKDKLTEEEIKYITKEEELRDAYLKYTSVLVDKQKEVEIANKEVEIANKEVEIANKEVEIANKEVESVNKKLEKAQKEKEKAQKEKEKVQKEKEKAQKEKEKAQKEKEKAQKEKEKAQKEKERSQKALFDTAKLLLSMNTKIEKISKVTGLPIKEIKKLNK